MTIGIRFYFLILFLGLSVTAIYSAEKCSICEEEREEIIYCPEGRGSSCTTYEHNAGCANCFRGHLKECFRSRKNYSCGVCGCDISISLNKSIKFFVNNEKSSSAETFKEPFILVSIDN